MLNRTICILISAVGLTGGCNAWASTKCSKVQGDKKTEYIGTPLDGLQVEKYSLSALEERFPSLRITEKVFTGALLTCTDCRDNYVICGEDPSQPALPPK
jgi:hypothetical protein